MKVVKHQRPPLEQILTPEKVWFIEDLPCKKETVAGVGTVVVDPRLQAYIDLVNSACSARPPHAIFNRGHEWLPDPTRTYSAGEIVAHLATMGLHRFSTRWQMRPQRRRKVPA